MADSKIRVLHIGLSSTYGGIEAFLYNLNCRIDRAEYQFDYVCYGQLPSYSGRFSSLGATLFSLGNRGNAIRHFRELESLFERGYDIVHIHKNSAADVIPFLVAQRAGSAHVIAHAHNTGSNLGCFGNLAHKLGRREILKTADRLLACSRLASEWLYGKASYGNHQDVEIVPNGIDLEKFSYDGNVRTKVRAELGVRDELVIGCVGRFTQQKNQAFLIGVLEELIRANVGLRLLFLGDGESRDKVEDMARDAGVSRYALFAGNVSNVADYMQAMDVLAMPSHYEGMPLVAIEAQAAGLPIVASDAVTEDVNLTGRVTRLGISDGAFRWAEALVDASGSVNRGKSTITEGLKRHDSRETARLIDSIYREVLGI